MMASGRTSSMPRNVNEQYAIYESLKAPMFLGLKEKQKKDITGAIGDVSAGDLTHCQP